jgi:cytochrome b561
MTQAEKQRYPTLIIVLHWVMALAIIGMLVSGLVMTGLDTSESFTPMMKFNVYQLHKSFGFMILVSVVARLAIRVFSQIPPLPDHFPVWEKWAAKAGHFALYAAMFALPISGWVIVSSSSYGLPTYIFGWFEWPHLPGLAGQAGIEDAAKEIHETLAYLLMGLIVLHVSAAAKHAIWDKENLLTRLWWFKNGK